MALFWRRRRSPAAAVPTAPPRPVLPGAGPQTGQTGAAGSPPGRSGEKRPPELILPEGWEIADYAGEGGRSLYAVFENGRRMASGMPSPQSAARWARLLAASRG
jgi:hypothetical protein